MASHFERQGDKRKLYSDHFEPPGKRARTASFPDKGSFRMSAPYVYVRGSPSHFPSSPCEPDDSLNLRAPSFIDPSYCLSAHSPYDGYQPSAPILFGGPLRDSSVSSLSKSSPLSSKRTHLNSCPPFSKTTHRPSATAFSEPNYESLAARVSETLAAHVSEFMSKDKHEPEALTLSPSSGPHGRPLISPSLQFNSQPPSPRSVASSSLESRQVPSVSELGSKALAPSSPLQSDIEPHPVANNTTGIRKPIPVVRPGVRENEVEARPILTGETPEGKRRSGDAQETHGSLTRAITTLDDQALRLLRERVVEAQSLVSDLLLYL